MKKFMVIVVASVSVVGLLGLPSAWATQKGPQSTDVSCDGVTVKSGVMVTMGSNGKYQIKYNSASGGASGNDTWWTARSANGNDLEPQKASVPPQTVSWSPVIKSAYTPRILRRFAANCNGILPGNGNYSVNYTITYPG